MRGASDSQLPPSQGANSGADAPLFSDSELHGLAAGCFVVAGVMVALLIVWGVL